MINKKDNVIEFVERLEAKKRAEQKVLEQTTQSPNIKKVSRKDQTIYYKI